MMSHGVTGFEAEDHEKVSEVAITSTGQSRAIPMQAEDPETGEMKPVNIRHGLYAFQAVLVSHAPEGEEIPASPTPDGAQGQAVLIPGASNREERRKAQKGKKK